MSALRSAAQPRARCGTTSCAAPPVGAVELSWRRVTTTAGQGRVGRKCSAADKHGTYGEHGKHGVTHAQQRRHRRTAVVTRTQDPSTATARQRRKHGSNARTAAPHRRSNTAQHGSSSAAPHRRAPQACGVLPCRCALPLRATVGR